MAPVFACLITAARHGDATTTSGYLPAILLTDDSEPVLLRTRLEHLVFNGWSYAEPPVRLTPIPPARSDVNAPNPDRAPLLFVPCQPLDEDALTRCNRAPQSAPEWRQRVREIDRRCALVLGPSLDGPAAELSARLNTEASRGRIVWTTVRMASRDCAHRSPSDPLNR
jgi:hypothetical protein